MSNRSVVVLLIVALSLAAMVLLFERQISQEVRPAPDEYKVFKAYSKDQVDSVSLVDGELAVRLERDAEGWHLSSLAAPPADENRVDKLLEQLGKLMEVASPIKAAPGEKINLADYGLSNPSRRIIVSYGGVAEAALSLGRQTEKHNQLYARWSEENRVIIINAEVSKLLEEIAADQNFYRSRNIFQDKHINKALEIQLLTAESQGTKPLVLQKDEQTGRWVLKSPFEDRADQETVQKLLEECATLRVAEFIKLPTERSELANKLRDYGLTRQEKTPSIALAAEGMQTVLLHLGQTDEQGKYRYALVEKSAVLAASQEVVKIPADFLEALPKSVSLLRDTKFLRFDQPKVNEIQLSGPEGTTALARAKPNKDNKEPLSITPGQWIIRLAENQREIAADYELVNGFLGELQQLTATGFAGAAKTDMGFDKPYLWIQVKTEQKGKEATLQVGALTDDGQNRYARLADDTSVRTVSQESVGKLVHNSFYFYERKLAEVGRGDVKSCKISAAGQDEREAVNKEGQWWLTKPATIRADNEAVKNAIAIFDPLRAQKIVADKVADSDVQALAPYELDEPKYQLTVIRKSKKEVQQTESQPPVKPGAKYEDTEASVEQYVLLVGKAADEQAQQYYGRLKGRELVFTVPKEAVDKLAGDWRDKKVLPLVSWQINQLSKVEISKGSEVLSLEKPRDNWQVLSPKNFWPDQQAVKALLESLAGLEASEFSEKPSDKQYGLESPAMVVSVTLDEAGSAKQQKYQFFVGQQVEGKGYAVKTEDEDAVRLVAAEKLELLQQSYLTLRKKEMLSFDAKKAQAIEIVAGDKKRCRAEGIQTAWKLTVPAGAGLEMAKLEGILGLMSNLRASRIVADTLEEAKKYGLEKPYLTVTVELAGEADEKIIHSLLIGDEVKDSGDKKEAEKQPRPRYAALAGNTTVFVLSTGDVQVLEKGLVFEHGEQ